MRRRIAAGSNLQPGQEYNLLAEGAQNPAPGALPRVFANPNFRNAPVAVWGDVNLSGRLPRHYKEAVATFGKGSTNEISKTTLQAFNLLARKRFYGGDANYGVATFKPITRKELFDLLAADDPDGGWHGRVIHESWGKKKALFVKRKGKVVVGQNGLPILKYNSHADVPNLVTRESVMRIQARQNAIRQGTAKVPRYSSTAGPIQYEFYTPDVS